LFFKFSYISRTIILYYIIIELSNKQLFICVLHFSYLKSDTFAVLSSISFYAPTISSNSPTLLNSVFHHGKCLMAKRICVLACARVCVHYFSPFLVPKRKQAIIKFLQRQQQQQMNSVAFAA